MEHPKKKLELPLLQPMYSTYHHQGPATATLCENPSIRNFYLNQVMNLTCTRRFLSGYTSPEISVAQSQWKDNPYLDRKWYSMQFLGGYVHSVIRNFLDAGYYVCFSGIDDYYVAGKSWYRERHFKHDGCICGYDREDQTYCIYAYDENWIYQKFRTPQKAFEAGRRAMFRAGQYGSICGIKPKKDPVAFSPETVQSKIAEYLSSDRLPYPETEDGTVSGIAVHDYIALYLEKLCDGSIPYERIDRRVFRMIWEHKKAMLERIVLLEDAWSAGHEISESYRSVVREADNCRMLYAAHLMKQRNALLPVIRQKLCALKEKEKKLLNALPEIQRRNQNETMV